MKLLCETDKFLIEVMNYTNLNEIEDPELLVKTMHGFMLDNHGLGLAAPQIGLNYRMFIMGESGFYRSFWNPEIIEKSDELQKSEEGCLTFPGLFIKIPRAESVVVKATNEHGNLVEERFTGIWARCFLHEYDHLNGILFTERAGKTSLSLAKNRRKKLLKRMNTHV